MELVGWILQIGLIAVVVFRPSARLRFRAPTIAECLLVVSLGWVLRLVYLFSLASGGLQYWIGDEPLRWLTAWQWAEGSLTGAGIPPAWMPGTSYLHGLAMQLTPDPLYGSKLLSAVYAVMPLAGLFIFAQAVFRHRALSLACVIFWTPFWIEILLSSGTMTELPMTGLMLGGAGALIAALRMPLGPRRTRLLFASALSFCLATLFHLVAWMHLTGVLIFVLPVFVRESHGTLFGRFRSWVLFCAGSTAYCFAWAVDTWMKTGNPFTPFLAAANFGFFKIGGPTDILQILGEVATLPQRLVVGLAVVMVAIFFGMLRLRPDADGKVFGRVDAGRIPLLKGMSAVAMVLVCALALGPLEEWRQALPPAQFARLMTNWGIYPVSILYCVFYFLPLVVYGLVALISNRETRESPPAVVFCGMVFVFAILVASALNGGAGISPFRTVLSLSAALIPFSLAPFFDLRPDAPPLRRGRSPVAALCVVLAIATIGHQGVANHNRIFSELPMPSIFIMEERQGSHPTGADAIALGAWIRTEIALPGYLSPENLSQPFELLLKREWLGMKQTLIEYYVGDPARFAHPGRMMKRPAGFHQKTINGLSKGQVLIADFEIWNPRLRLIARISEYRIYESVAP